MERDRTTALSYFLRFLSGNPDGDATTRALVLGALAPVDVSAAQIYAASGPSALELIGNYGFDEVGAASYRTLPAAMPLPICEAFTSMRAVTVSIDDLPLRYPILESEGALMHSTAAPGTRGTMICAPVLFSGVPIGAVTLHQEFPVSWEPGDWHYLDGVTAAVGMWMNNQREILVERWRRHAPTPPREVRISERQQDILEMVARSSTNAEIARKLGYSVPTIKKDLQHLMQMLGTHDRRTTAGRAREIGMLPERRAGAE